MLTGNLIGLSEKNQNPGPGDMSFSRDSHKCKSQGQSKKILIIDDDEWIRGLIADILTEFGYQVFLAADGQQACRIYQNHSGSIDLVTLDMEMPLLNGVETFQRLKKINKDVKVIIISGSPSYSGFNPQKSLRLNKPFSPKELLDRITQLISG